MGVWPHLIHETPLLGVWPHLIHETPLLEVWPHLIHETFRLMVLAHGTCLVVWFHLTQGAPSSLHLGVWPHLAHEISQLVVRHCLEHLLHLTQGAPPSLHLGVWSHLPCEASHLEAWSHLTHKDLCPFWLGVRLHPVCEEDCSLGECPHQFPSSHLLYGSCHRPPQVYWHHLVLYQGMGSHLVEEVFPPGKWAVLVFHPSCWGEHLHLVHKVLVL